jgi:hypothetical protein
VPAVVVQLQGGPSLPLLLDVLLVGRTKMLRLHSCIWLQNNTSMRLQPCLQLGAGCRTPVVLAPGDKLDAMQRLHLRVGGCGSTIGSRCTTAERVPAASSGDSCWSMPSFSCCKLHVMSVGGK